MTLRATAQANAQRLKAKKNVVGVGEGPNNKIAVLVRKKESVSALRAVDIVDPIIPDVDDPQHFLFTDVIEVGNVRMLRDIPDTLHPGASIGMKGKLWAGTAGCFVELPANPGELYILSNNHVIADKLPLGSKVVHPAPPDANGWEPVVVAHLSETIDITFNKPNYIDAAIAKVVNQDWVLDNGGISALTNVTVDTEVGKTGRTSGYTEGVVLALNVSINVDYDSEVAVFENQILTSKMLDPGDSGSVGIIPGTNDLWGLGFAGSEQVGIFNPIQEVFSRLDLQLPAEESFSAPPKEGCLTKIRKYFGF